MRYDDILHESFITAINGIVANPANQVINASSVVDDAWKIAVFAANKALASGPTLIPMVFNNTSVPSDPVATSLADGSVNNPTTGIASTLNPTNVLSPSGGYIAPKKV